MKFWNYFQLRKQNRTTSNAPMRTFVARNISHSTDKATLRGIGFTLSPGDSICIGYRSMEEKNLLLSLLSGQVQPAQGVFVYDGNQQRPSDLAALSGVFAHNLRTIEQAQTALVEFLETPSKICLLDQPFGSLPGSTTKQFALAIDTKAREKSTIVFSNNRSIARRCNQVYVLNNGHLEDYYTASKTPELNPFNNTKILDEARPEPKQTKPATPKTPIRSLDPIHFRAKVSDTGDIEDWIGWHRQRIEPIVIRKAVSDAGLKILSQEREALNGISSLRIARMYDSNSNELNLFEYVNINPLATTEPLNSFQICALAADLLTAAKELNPLVLDNRINFSEKAIGLRNGLWMLTNSGLGTAPSETPLIERKKSHRHSSEIDKLANLATGVPTINQIISSQLSRSLAAGKATGADIRPICAILDESEDTSSEQLASSYSNLLGNIYGHIDLTEKVEQQKLNLWSS